MRRALLGDGLHILADGRGASRDGHGHRAVLGVGDGEIRLVAALRGHDERRYSRVVFVLVEAAEQIMEGNLNELHSVVAHELRKLLHQLDVEARESPVALPIILVGLEVGVSADAQRRRLGSARGEKRKRRGNGCKKSLHLVNLLRFIPAFRFYYLRPHISNLFFSFGAASAR